MWLAVLWRFADTGVSGLTVGSGGAERSERINVKAINVLKAHVRVASLGPAWPSRCSADSTRKHISIRVTRLDSGCRRQLVGSPYVAYTHAGGKAVAVLEHTQH
jgi:hypothetical protein